MRSRLIIGCGYLGRRVARRWLDAGDDVAALTRSEVHAEEFRSEGIRPIVGDILDSRALRGVTSAQTVLYAVGFDRTTAASKREVYVDGLRNVLQALPAGVGQFLYVSSTSVYGQSQGETVDETSACLPQSEGGRICLDAERLLHEGLGDRVPTHVLRLSGIYGPGRLIARIEALREHRPLPGHPESWLNLIHVADAARVIVACAQRHPAGSELWLVSDDRPVHRRTYYETLARLVGAPPPRFAAVDEPSRNLGKRCNNRRLRDALGVRLEFPTIDEGLADAVRGISV
jgi:nucleoside-diphosphate-sugar epimerase